MEPADEFARAVRDGLSGSARTLPCRFFYDAKGSELFEEICRLPEYYLTRTEDRILRESSAEIVALPEPFALVELGSGSAEKTRHLIAAAVRRFGQLHYVPVDVSKTALQDSAQALVHDFPTLQVTGYVADYRQALDDIGVHIKGPKLFAFLGSSLGNYDADQATSLLTQVGAAMTESDRLVLGTDMAKPASVLEPAYDDSQGVTARFNLNILERINRELGANFDLGRFQHRATYRPDRGRVEMYLVSTVRQHVTIPGAGLEVVFNAGEAIHTENSHKYTETMLRSLACRSGFTEEAAWSDERGWFRVGRWRPSAPDPA